MFLQVKFHIYYYIKQRSVSKKDNALLEDLSEALYPTSSPSFWLYLTTSEIVKAVTLLLYKIYYRSIRNIHGKFNIAN